MIEPGPDLSADPGLDPVPSLVTPRRLVAALLVTLFLGGWIWAFVTGAVTTASIRAWLDSLGAAGPPLLVLAFVGGSMAGMPGVVFVIAGRLAFGAEIGFVVGYAGGFIASTLPFVLARALQRDPIKRELPRLLRWMVALVDRRPLRAVVISRLIVWYSPTASYAFALTSKVRGRVYALGCAMSLLPVTLLVCFLTGWFA